MNLDQARSIKKSRCRFILIPDICKIVYAPDIVLTLVIHSLFCHPLDSIILQFWKVYILKSFKSFYVTRPQPSGTILLMRERERLLPLTWACCYGLSPSYGICMWLMEKLLVSGMNPQITKQIISHSGLGGNIVVCI